MFRKTFICVAGVVAGVSAGAYSSGFFNQENIVTTTYSQAVDRMGLGEHDDASISNGFASGEAESLVSGSVNVSAATEPAALTDTSGSGSGNLAHELLAAGGISRSRLTEPLDSQGMATDLANKAEEKAALKAALKKEKELAARKAELQRELAEIEKDKVEESRRQAQAQAQALVEARLQKLVETRFAKEVYESSTGEKLNYRRLMPNNLQKDKLYPLVIFLHGKGERGDDNQSQLKHGLKVFAADEGMKRFPAIVIAPQCPADQLWAATLEQKDTTPKMTPQPTPSMRLVIELLDSMLLTESVDPNRVYVTGLSMGGFGTFDLIARRPALFAAAVPLCGGGDPSPAAIRRLLRMPMWVVHGTDDSVVNINRSREMVYALESAGAAPRYSELEGFGHNIWDATYGDIELYNWMFNQSKAGVINRRTQGPQASRANNASRSTAAARANSANASRRPTSRRPTPIGSARPRQQLTQPSSIENRTQALLGQWKVLAASQKGKQADKKILEKMSVTFEKDQFVIQIDDRKEVAKFKLGNSARTPQINIISDREGIKESAGIYELRGDRLIICWGEPGRPRPTRFVNFMNVKSLVLEKQ